MRAVRREITVNNCFGLGSFTGSHCIRSNFKRLKILECLILSRTDTIFTKNFLTFLIICVTVVSVRSAKRTKVYVLFIYWLYSNRKRFSFKSHFIPLKMSSRVWVYFHLQIEKNPTLSIKKKSICFLFYFY